MSNFFASLSAFDLGILFCFAVHLMTIFLLWRMSRRVDALEYNGQILERRVEVTERRLDAMKDVLSIIFGKTEEKSRVVPGSYPIPSVAVDARHNDPTVKLDI